MADIALVPAETALAPKMTLQDFVAKLAVIDQLSPDEVEKFHAIDFPTLLADLKDKVDDIHYVLQRMETVGEFLKAYTDPIVKKRLTIQKTHDRLWDYVAKVMRGDFLPEDQRQRTEMLPGHVHFVRLRDSNPALKIKRAPTAKDYEDFPELVEMRRSYEWKKDAVMEMLADLKTCEFAEITRGCWPEFGVKVPAQIEKKRKGAKK